MLSSRICSSPKRGPWPESPQADATWCRLERGQAGYSWVVSRLASHTASTPHPSTRAPNSILRHRKSPANFPALSLLHPCFGNSLISALWPSLLQKDCRNLLLPKSHELSARMVYGIYPPSLPPGKSNSFVRGLLHSHHFILGCSLFTNHDRITLALLSPPPHRTSAHTPD